MLPMTPMTPMLLMLPMLPPPTVYSVFASSNNFTASTTESYLISATSLFFSFSGGSSGVLCYHYPLFMPAFMRVASSFSFCPLSLFHPKSTLALALRVRDDTGPSSARGGGTERRAAGARLSGG